MNNIQEAILEVILSIEIDALINKFINEQRVKSQGEIHEYLKKYSFDISQPQLSRKLEKMRIIKKNGHYQVENMSFFSDIVIRMWVKIPDIILIKTKPGFANALAADIDSFLERHATFNNLITIAGDNAIMLPVEGHRALELMDLLKQRYQLYGKTIYGNTH